MFILSGADEASKKFAESLAKSLGEEINVLIEKKFPDGEQYVRLPKVPEHHEPVILVQTFAPPQDNAVVKTIFAIDALKEKGIEDISLVVPYLAYSRQDKEFLPNEAVSIRALLRVLKSMGLTRLFTIEIHKKDSLRYFGESAYSISPYEYMVKNIKLNNNNVVILAPDVGALDRAKRLASAMGTEFDYLVKRRDRVTGKITIEPKNIDVKDKDVIIVDDIISTGGTVAEASKLLLSQGASSIRVIVAHALMVGNALEKLKKSHISKIYACNTLPKIDDPLIEYIDVAPLVAEEIKRWIS